MSSNPPYGERLDSEPALIALHSLLGRMTKNQFGGWIFFVQRLAGFAKPLAAACRQTVQGETGSPDCVQKNYHVAESTPDSKPA